MAVDSGALRLEVTGLDEARYALERLSNCFTAAQMEPVMRHVGEVAKRATQEAFAKEAAPQHIAALDKAGLVAAGKPWAPFAPTTRRKRGGMASAKLLQDKGTLAGSINVKATGRSVAIGAGVYYGRFHQLGTKFMPARPFLGLNEADNRTIVDLILAHIRAARSA